MLDVCATCGKCDPRGREDFWILEIAQGPIPESAARFDFGRPPKSTGPGQARGPSPSFPYSTDAPGDNTPDDWQATTVSNARAGGRRSAALSLCGGWRRQNNTLNTI